ncbi:MAG: alkaline phosphatase D family protein [Bacteroidia bacterium]|nr:alkaline phosphatase D family protein [Bacteroidia bacterium]
MKNPILLILLAFFGQVTAFAQILPANMHADTAHAPFWEGVASGDPLPDRVILWTHFRADSFAAPPETLSWQVSVQASFASLAASGTVVTDSSLDWTAKVDAAGLSSGQPYFYRFQDSQGNYSAVGQTKTASTANLTSFKAAVMSCSALFSGFFNGYARVAERDSLDLVIHLGDFIYNSIDPDEEVRVPSPRPDDPETLREWRDRHALYHLDPDFRAAMQRHPFTIIWDNHDIASDPDTVPMKAFYEWTPTRLADTLVPRRIYRKFSFGNLVDLFMTDGSIMWRDLDTLPNGDPSTLGNDQKAWLLAGLAASTAKWRLIGTERQFARWGTQTFQAIFPTPGGVFSESTWDGYVAERTEILDFLAANHIDNVMLLSGDSHVSVAADLTRAPNPDNYDAQTGDGALGVEFLPTSISRGNFDEAGVPGFLISAIEAASKSENPWQRYLELTSHGYGTLDIDTAKITARFWYSDILNQATSETMAKEMYFVDGENHWHRGSLASIVPDLQPRFSLFPNPGHEKITLELENFPARPLHLELQSLLGQTLYQAEYPAGTFKTALNLPPLAPGTYLLKIRCGILLKTAKLVRE